MELNHADLKFRQKYVEASFKYKKRKEMNSGAEDNKCGVSCSLI
jgi:hypothetical protein